MNEVFEAFMLILGPGMLRSMWPYIMLWGPRKDWLDQMAESRWVVVWPHGEGVPA